MEDPREGGGAMAWARGLFAREIDLRPLWRLIRDHPADDIFWMGVVLRILDFSWGREFWLDECSLLGNLKGVAPLDFRGPLSGDQLAPFGFLALQRAIMAVLGDSEYATRILPLACGLISLVLFRRLADRWLPSAAAMVALALFAFSDDMTYYSSVVKQYASDVMFGLMLPVAAADRLDRKLGPKDVAVLGLLLMLAPWCSFPSAFLVAGVGVAFLADRAARGWWADLVRLGGIGAAWLVSFVLAYRASHALLHGATTMYVFWDFAFLPFPPSSAADVQKLAGVVLEVFVNPLNLVVPAWPRLGLVVPVTLLALGGYSLARRDWRILVILGLPILFAMGAAASRRYPFHGRLILALVPALFLIIAEGTEALRVRLGRPAYVTLLVALLLYPVGSTIYEAQSKRVRYFNSHGDLHDNRFVP